MLLTLSMLFWSALAAVSLWQFFKKEQTPSLRWLSLLSIAFALAVVEQNLWSGSGASYSFPGLKPVSFAMPYFFGVILLGFYQSNFGNDGDRRFIFPSFWQATVLGKPTMSKT